MTQPKNFGFGDDEKMLRDSARKFFSENSPIDAVHKLVADNPDPNREIEVKWNPDTWQQIVALGWAAVAVPERAGGLGMPAVAVASLAEEAGRSAYVGPLLTTLCSSVVLAACENEKADGYLAKVIDGKAFTLAVTDNDGEWNPNRSTVTVKDGRLNGTAYYVQDVSKCDCFIVAARNSNGSLDLYVVDKEAEGLSIQQDAIVDLTRDQGRLTFNDLQVGDADTLIQGQATEVLAKSEPLIITLIAADMVGAAEWQLQTTVEYAKTREQFGRPIGFFQAVKHPIVDMMVMIDQARGHVYNSACAFDTEPDDSEKCARMAKASAAEAAIFCSNRSVQLHGGIGFTWECYLHIYFKRQMHNQMLYGDAQWQRSKLADLLLEPLPA